MIVGHQGPAAHHEERIVGEESPHPARVAGTPGLGRLRGENGAQAQPHEHRGSGEKGEGGGSGTGGGGGIKPVGVIVVNKDGVRIEMTKGTVVPLVERITNAATRLMEKRKEGKKEEK